MSNVLARIVDNRRQQIARLAKARPLSGIIDGLSPSNRSLYDALGATTPAFILECKKASPSRGLIRKDFDLDAILAAYAPFACGVSVLTEPDHFQGDMDYLKRASAALSQPVLNKDFIVEPYQVYLARYMGADAILLMLSVLSDEQYLALSEIARHLSLDILTEVSNQQEAERAVALGARIIGINNRDLRDLSISLATTRQLAPFIRAKAPEARIISESGIQSHADVRALAPYCDGFLVGSALMAQTDLNLAIRSLIFGPVKVCGITRRQDAACARDAGASYAGLIFVEGSKRQLSMRAAKALVSAVPFNYVGVFANQTIERVAHAAHQLSLTAVQLHGDESDGYCQALRLLLPFGCEIWKVYGIKDALPHSITPYTNKVVLDTQKDGQRGGTGQTFDWSLLDGFNSQKPLVLAGGLCLDNLKAARRTVASVLDINSGVESAPGIKDHQGIIQAMTALRQY